MSATGTAGARRPTRTEAHGGAARLGETRHERRERRFLLALAAPALAVVLLLVALPLAWLVAQSFWADGPSLEHYRRILDDPTYATSFLLTFRVALTVSLATLALGYPLAYAAAHAQRPWDAAILLCVLLPFWTSVLVRTYAWLVLLQRSGLINGLLTRYGLIDEPLALVHNELGTVIATVHILLPFMVLPLTATMRAIPRDLLRAAASLGGNPAHSFLRVFLPLSMPGVIAGLTLVFVLALGFYITPELLGGGRTVMASMVVSRNVELYSAWGAASAVAVALLACVGLVFALVGRILPLERILGQR